MYQIKIGVGDIYQTIFSFHLSE